MFRKLHNIDQPVRVFIDGEPHRAERHETVAAVLIRQDTLWSRQSAISGEKRAPFCMMGVCYECLVTIDGIGSMQSCLVTVRDGMRIERQIGARDVDL